MRRSPREKLDSSRSRRIGSTASRGVPLSKSPETGPDDVRLHEEGFDPSATPVDAIAKLRELRGRPGISDASIARAIGAIADPSAAAMLAAQQTLAAEDFSAIDGLRVRAAIHTGIAERREGDYFGPAVNKVARLLAIGHGGQILLTSETTALVVRTLPADVTLRDLGAYHLKDFTEPQRVFQLLAPGLPAEFPPLRSLGTLPSDLSVVDTAAFHSVPSFSGRDDDLAADAQFFQGGDRLGDAGADGAGLVQTGHDDRDFQPGGAGLGGGRFRECCLHRCGLDG